MEQSLFRSFVTGSHEEENNAVFSAMGERLRQGGLVAFPTETVYGLGANALDAAAVMRIFETKRRPLSDPVICHVKDAEAGLELWDNPSPVVLEAYEQLTMRFWPGPLSLIFKANDRVPAEVTASTGFVAIRCPRSQLAIRLLRAANVPVAAPSANKFGRISPSQWEHVAAAFDQDDVWLLEGPPCLVGVESTVAKIEVSTNENNVEERVLRVLRPGAVTMAALQQCLDKLQQGWKVLGRSDCSSHAVNNDDQNSNTHSTTAATRVTLMKPVSAAAALQSKSEVQRLHDATGVAVLQETHTSHVSPEAESSPGMLLTHYAPKTDTFLLQVQGDNTNLVNNANACNANTNVTLPMPSRTVLVDLFNVLQSNESTSSISNTLQRNAIAIITHQTLRDQTLLSDEDKAYFASEYESEYVDAFLALCGANRKTQTLAHDLFASLHAADTIATQQHAEAIFLMLPNSFEDALNDGLAAAVLDRLYRAASGRLLIATKAANDTIQLIDAAELATA